VTIDNVTIIYFVALVAAVILHEISHGVVALWFGDDTAKRAHRLTLNPIPHIDPLGSIILPAFGALTGAPVIGWAKPVPVNPNRLRHPRADMLIVSLAGPATNFLLCAISAVIARTLYKGEPFSALGDLPLQVLIPLQFAVVNLFLGIFNFLPIPPLDGSAIVERLLPEKWLPRWYQFRQFGFLILFALVFYTGIVGTILNPFLDRLYNFVLGI
jgi:Zn-dependent protease